MSTRKSSSAKKAGRPPKEPPKGTLGWRIREARKKRGLDPSEVAAKVGLTDKMISAGELGSPFSTSALMLLAMVLKDDFGEKWLRTYARYGKFIEIYESMTPDARKHLAELQRRAGSGDPTPFPTDDEDEEGEGS